MTTAGTVLKKILAGRSVRTLDRVANDGEFGILKVSAVTWGEFRSRENKAMPSDFAPGEQWPRALRGDLLITRANTRELVGAPVMVEGDHPTLLLSDKLLKLVPDASKVDSRYLMHALRAPAAKIHFESRAGGSSGSMTNITQEDIRSAPIPLRPIEEQRRIAAILDQAEALRARRSVGLALVKELSEAIFSEMFGDVVTNERRWPETAVLGEVADVVSGVTKGRKVNGAKVRSVPYLAVANVQDKALKLDTVKMIDATEEEIRRYRLRHDDLLLTEGGDPDKLGRGSLWQGELPECIHQNHVFRVRLKSALVTPLFLNWLVGSRRGKNYFLRSAKQTTGIASINMTQLRGFPLLVPPRAVQEEFGRRISEIEVLRGGLQAATVEQESLFASLQHRAFSGQL